MPRLYKGSPWQQFKQKWQDCSRCSLCESRFNIVLCRGNIPCDVLFIGEAPGPSEDAVGQPFVGPAGKLLDKQIKEALSNCPGADLRMCYTNLVCCIPKEGAGKAKFKEPPKEAIEACSARLNEFVNLCEPSAIVLVGDLAEKHIQGQAQFGGKYEPNTPGWSGRIIDFVKITHPAAIIRAEVVRQELMYHKSVVILENLFQG